MTPEQEKNVLRVVDAMNRLRYIPRESAFIWARLLNAVAKGFKCSVESNTTFFQVMKIEPEVFRMLWPDFLYLMPQQESCMSVAHARIEKEGDEYARIYRRSY